MFSRSLSASNIESIFRLLNIICIETMPISNGSQIRIGIKSRTKQILASKSNTVDFAKFKNNRSYNEEPFAKC